MSVPGARRAKVRMKASTAEASTSSSTDRGKQRSGR